MKNNLLAAVVVGVALLMTGCGVIPRSEQEAARDAAQVAECKKSGGYENTAVNGTFIECVYFDAEENDAKTLACITAGGVPKVRRKLADVGWLEFYRGCGAKPVVTQTNPWAELHRKNQETFRSWDTSMPEIQNPNSGDLRCETRRTINGNYETRCKQR